MLLVGVKLLGEFDLFFFVEGWIFLGE